MGMAKRLWMEMEELEWEYSSVFFDCPICGNASDDEADLPVVYQGGEIDNIPIEITCSCCGEEYSATLNGDWDSYEIDIDGYTEVVVEAPPVRGFSAEPDWDIDFEIEQPESSAPKAVFDVSIQGIYHLIGQLQTSKTISQNGLLARMLLVQIITTLEAYLGDTLLRSTSLNTEAQDRLLRSKKLEIGTQTFSLSDASGIENFAFKKLIAHLNHVSFHNLSKVQKLYQIGLQLDIVPEKEVLENLNKAISMRHDCVHRNGRPKGSDEATEVSLDFLLVITKSTVITVEAIEAKLLDIS